MQMYFKVVSIYINTKYVYNRNSRLIHKLTWSGVTGNVEIITSKQ